MDIDFSSSNDNAVLCPVGDDEMSSHLDERIQALVDYIVTYALEHGYMPSSKEMAEATFAGHTTIRAQLLELHGRGFIEYKGNRAIRVPGLQYEDKREW